MLTPFLAMPFLSPSLARDGWFFSNQWRNWTQLRLYQHASLVSNPLLWLDLTQKAGTTVSEGLARRKKLGKRG